MTQLSEADFHELVAAWLAESFAEVEHEVTLPSGRRPDFIAHTPFHSYVLEVEDSADSLYDCIGQAAVYAEETGHDPVAVFPADDAPDPGEIPDWLTLETL